MDEELQRPPVGLSLEERWARVVGSQQEKPGEGGLVRTTLRGAARAGLEMSDAVLSLGRGIVRHTGMYKALGNDSDEWLEWYEKDVDEVNPLRSIYTPAGRASGAWGFYESMVEFGTGFAVGGAATRGLAGMKVVRGLVAGGIADGIAFDPQEERLSNLVQNAPWPVHNAVTEFLAADEDDGELEGRLKNVLEGAVIGGTLDAAFSGIKALRARRLHAKGKITSDELQALEETYRAEANQVEDAIAEAGDTEIPMYRVEPTEDGAWQAVRQGADDVAAEGEETFPKVRFFDNPAQARHWADGIQLTRKLLAKPEQRIRLDPGQRASVKKVMARIASGVDPDDAESLYAGTDINLGHIETADDAKAAIIALQEVLGEAVADVQKRVGGVPFFERAGLEAGQSNAETLKLAKGMIQGVDEDTLVNHLGGILGVTQVLPQHVVAARLLVASQANRVARLAKHVGMDPTHTLVVKALTDEMDRLATTTVHLSGLSSDLGRALQAFGIDLTEAGIKEGEQAMAKGMAKRAEEAALNAGAINLAKEPKPFTKIATHRKFKADEIASIARTLEMTEGDSNAMLRAMRLTVDSARRAEPGSRNFTDQLITFRASMMLNGPRTHVTNFISSMATSIQLPVEYIIGGHVGKDPALTKFGWDMLSIRRGSENLWMVQEAFQGLKRAWKENRSILDPEFVKDDQGILSVDPGDQIVGLWNNVLHAPGRALVSGDEFVKRMAYLQHVRAQSMAKMRSDALETGIELTKAQTETRLKNDLRYAVDEDGYALWANSLQHAREATFTRKLYPGTLGHKLQTAANDHASIRFIVPFVRTPVNILNFTFQRVPGAHLFNQEMKMMWEKGGRDRAIAQGRMATGGILYSMGALAAHNGQITGGGPGDPALRKQYMNAGWQPYSVKMGNKWISYRRLEPIATPLAIMADAFEAAGELKAEDMEEVSMALLAGMTASVSSKTFLIGITDFFDAIGSGEAWKAEQFVRSFANSFTPAALRQYNEGAPKALLGDEVWRDANSLVESLRRNVPGLSQGLEPRRNIFGEPVMRTSRITYGPLGDMLNTTLNPFTVVDGREMDDLLPEFKALGKALPMPSDQYQGMDLRDRRRWANSNSKRAGQSPYDRWMEIVDEMGLREDLTRLMRSDAYKRFAPGPEGGRVIMAQRRVSQYQRAARNKMLREYPDLLRAVGGQRQLMLQNMVEQAGN